MKINTVGKGFSVAERAYFAGFLDADGAIMATIEKHQEKKFGYRVRITLKITQADEKVLRWFLNRSHVGYIRKNRTTFDWIVRDQKIIKDLLKILIPYLRVKRKQAKKAIKIIESKVKSYKDLKSIALQADSLSQLNVRSKNRRKNFASMIQENFSRND